MIRLTLALGAIAMIGVSGNTVASEQALNAFFKDVEQLSADFTQRVEDERGSVLESTSGKLYLARPGKFRWDYYSDDQLIEGVVENGGESTSPSEPYLGQQIVANGEHLFFYDPDLEQVSKRKLDDAIGQVPSLLLVQDGADIDQHFSVTDYGVTDGLSWVSLKPKDADAGYQQLMIGFDEGLIAALLLYDGLGNSTQLKLKDVELQTKIDPTVFEFTVPDGADIITE